MTAKDNKPHPTSPLEVDATGFIKPGEYKLANGLVFDNTPKDRNAMSIASFRAARAKDLDMVYCRGKAYSGSWLLTQRRVAGIPPTNEQIKAALEGDGVIDL
jgi:hypothetical protein